MRPALRPTGSQCDAISAGSGPAGAPPWAADSCSRVKSASAKPGGASQTRGCWLKRSGKSVRSSARMLPAPLVRPPAPARSSARWTSAKMDLTCARWRNPTWNAVPGRYAGEQRAAVPSTQPLVPIQVLRIAMRLHGDRRSRRIVAARLLPAMSSEKLIRRWLRPKWYAGSAPFGLVCR